MPGWILVIALVIVVGGAYSVARNWPDGDRPRDADGSRSPGTESAYDDPVVTGRIEDPAITEASGLIASRATPGVFWTHNDSGGSPVVYCLSIRGTSCGSVTVSGVSAEDWEDIGIGPGSGSDWDLYIGDIGDNRRERDTVQVHRIPEPGPDAGETSTPADTIELSYPDEPHDAETLLVHPTTGDIYIVTKELSSRSMIFKAEAPLDAEMELQRIGTITIEDFLSDRTGGDISPDGTRVILSTYAAGYELVLPPGAPFDEIWRQEPQRVDIGGREQGEAITYSSDGASLFATSEGVHPPLFRIDRDTP